ncbi:PLP-dependent aminotransferase family protein [Thalassoglobus sp. JC818]|uniref:MocR-like pyridoxine biosynthesis transcription factor PdxR n=1 Tax=Thalassoglobus sp. JC818 TaxID=3232136 RepID=UPI003457F2F8
MVNRKQEYFEFEAIHLDDDSQTHRYVQLEQQIRRAIVDRRLPAGSRIPSSRNLAKLLNVSRNTVLTAYDQLISEGYLKSSGGSGTRVATVLPETFEHKTAKLPAKHSSIGTEELSRVGKTLAQQADPVVLTPQKVLPFLPHVPAVDEFPIDVWNRLTNEQSRWTRKHLVLCEPIGYRPLRESIAEYMGLSRGVECSPDQVVITSSAQQSMMLLGQLLLDPGDVVWVEEPGNLPANSVLELSGAKIEGIPVDEEGLDLTAAELKRSPRMICVTPGGQWPLTMTMSLNRRLELLARAQESKSWVVEDDYNGEFRYNGRPHRSLTSLDPTGRTIYMGTFSKVLFPSIRMAFLVVPPALAEAFAMAKWLQDRGTSPLPQMVLHRFIETGNFVKHLRRMRTLYAERQRFLFEGLQEHFGKDVVVTLPESGLHLVVFGRTEKIEQRLIAAAERANVRFHLVKFYAIDPESDSSRGIILGFAAYGKKLSKRALRDWASEFHNC